MDIVTLGAALNGSAEYVNSHFKGGSNIQIVDNPDGTQTINASGEVSAEDTVARAEIAAIKDGETLDSFGDVETALGDKADTSTTYTKTEVDTALSAKANSADVYSKTAVDTALDNKADKSTTYTKTEVDTALSAKADKSTTYTKTEVDTALGGKVDKETGKGLSTNDYTTAEKTKLSGIAEDAEVNEIESIKVNNTTVNPDSSKVVNITVPTSAADVSALPDTTKYAAALSLTINSSTFVMTGQLKDQNGDNLGTAQTIDLPLESVVVGGSYNSQTKKVVLTLQNGNTIEFSVADLVSGLQTELSTSNKLNPAFIEYDSTHRAVSDTEKSTWNGKQNALSSTQLAAVNSGIDSTKVEHIETNKNNISKDEAALVDLVDSGAKNLLNCSINTLKQILARGTWNNNVYTNNTGDVFMTVNSDNTLTISATNVTANRTITIGTLEPNQGNLYFSCTPNIEGAGTKFRSGINYVGYDDGEGLNVPNLTTPRTIQLEIIGSSASPTTLSNIVYKPMLCTKAALDISHEYQPYRPSYQELYEQVETNKNNILIEDISDKITATSGYTINSLTKLYMQGSHVFGHLIVSKNDGNFGGAQETIARFSNGYRPRDVQVQGCFFGTTEYNTQYTGYAYIQLDSASSGQGSVIVKGYQTDVGTVANIHVDFIV